MDHHGTSSLHLDHLSIWIIITRSVSSLDMDHHHQTGSGSSLDLDHHCWIWIITRSGSLGVIIIGSGSQLDLDLIWSSSYVLSHDSSRHRNFYRAILLSCWLQAQPSCRSSSALISDLLVRMVFPAPTSDLLVRKVFPTLTSNHVEAYNHIRKAQHSHSPV